MNQQSYNILFALILTATVMTIFEIIFAYAIVFPSLKPAIKRNIQKIPKLELNNYAQKMEHAVIDEIYAFVNTAKIREEKLITKINTHSKFFAALLVITLSIIVILLRLRIKKMTWSPYILSMMTIIPLVIFQICFYLMTSPNARPKPQKGTLLFGVQQFLSDLPMYHFTDPKSHAHPAIKTACKNTTVENIKRDVSEIRKYLEEIANLSIDESIQTVLENDYYNQTWHKEFEIQLYADRIMDATDV